MTDTTFRPQEDFSQRGSWWHREDERIICDLCPRHCSMKPGDRGFCFVRENRDGQMVLSTYGKSTGFCVDPIEKKPLNHFYPGTSVLSFGTAGCNLGCKFCQNWSISKSREVERLSEHALPETIAAAAVQLGCRSVAFTYNDPVIWAEYAIDTAKACHEQGIKTVAVTAAYITEQARESFFRHIDAANCDLKAFSEHFYQSLTLSHLQPVLDTLAWLKRETDVWFEVTNLIIPNANDGDDEFRRMCDWILRELGDEIPLHFTAFHPDFKLRDRERTPKETLLRAYDIATSAGVKYVYVGNVHDVAHQSTYCAHCGKLVIERDWHALGRYHLASNACRHCGGNIAGHFDPIPGRWGRKRLPVQIGSFSAKPTENNHHRESLHRIAGDEQEKEEEMAEPQQSNRNPNDVDAPDLSDSQKQAAIKAVSETVRSAVLNQPLVLSDPTLAGAAEVPVFGCFVSIKRAGKLRGCCGFLGQRATLLQAILESARTSAVGDSRLPPISPSELPFLRLEIWLLHHHEPIHAVGEARIDEIEIGKHGLQIQAGQHRGLLLPGVATDHGMDAAAFLRQVCMKAGLPPTAWREKDTQLARFQGYLVEGDFDRTVLDDADTAERRLLADEEIIALEQFCRANIQAALTGAVPTYYLPGCSDGTINGLCLNVQVQGRDWPIRIAQVAARDPFPMQSSLQKACETIGLQLRNENFAANTPFDLELAILYRPAMHGSVDNPDLGGVDTRYRAVMVSQGAKSAWLFDPSKQPEDLLQEAATEAQVKDASRTVVTSYVVQSNRPRMAVKNVPQPLAGPPVRPPAVAGYFYPADPSELNDLIESVTPKDQIERRPWNAAMVPHAGLLFSGKLAADVLRRIEIPQTVVVIGPKHTQQGTDWAVAPHESWQTPLGNISSDVALAKRLAEAIDGLEMDALAHQREHAIEVELPFLQKFAPQANVIGIAIGPATYNQCVEFGEKLAETIKDQADDILLLISSDMNHFATDEETRRVDEIALQAIESLDPKRVFDDVRGNDISMCGVLPAVIAMTALKKLDRLHRVERVGYSTSADVTNDKSRVVGYAGLLMD